MGVTVKEWTCVLQGKHLYSRDRGGSRIFGLVGGMHKNLHWIKKYNFTEPSEGNIFVGVSFWCFLPFHTSLTTQRKSSLDVFYNVLSG